LLATRLILAQGIQVIGLHFITPFFGYEVKGRETSYVERMRAEYGIEARVIDVSEEFLSILRNPRHGYGKNFNPCVDCKIFLFSKAKAIMERENADFLVTGEVLGQRPLSQRRDTLRVVERDSGTDGLLLRPLSAKSLKPTRPEISGIVDREKLLGLSGRGRKPQMKLAEDLGIKNYPTPAGGCVLTDPILANRIRDFFLRHPVVTINEVLLLEVGRHFRLPDEGWLILGRDEKENQRLETLGGSEDLFLKIDEVPGPLGLLRGKGCAEQLMPAAAILLRYSKARKMEQAGVLYGPKRDPFCRRLMVSPAPEEQVASLRF